MPEDPLADAAETRVAHLHVWFLGSRIEVRDLRLGETISINPLVVRLESDRYAIVFRYGAVALVNVPPEAAMACLAQVRPFVTEPFEAPETEEVSVVIAGDRTEGLDADGTLRLQDVSIERLQVVANVLAKSAVLASYEERVAEIFESFEQVIEQVKRGSQRRRSGPDLLQQIGDVLIAEAHTVGRVEVSEKPEITWDRPDLDRLYERLSVEYELRERDRALTRKLEFVSDTARTYLDMLEAGKSLRLEFYILLLIVVEVLLFVYDLFRT